MTVVLTDPSMTVVLTDPSMTVVLTGPSIIIIVFIFVQSFPQVYLKSSYLLQSCQRVPGVIAGCLFVKHR